MADAAASNAHTSPDAVREWARQQIARTMVRAAMDSTNLIYRRTWPSQDALALADEAGRRRRQARSGWFDSTLALRDGLSVVEVFAPIDARIVLAGACEGR